MTRKRAIATARHRAVAPRRALDTPGISIDKSMGRYVTHNDYTTSQALNEFFDTGGTRFFVQREGDVFEVDITDDD